MAIPIIKNWAKFFDDYNEGLGSSYERIVLNNLLYGFCSRYKVKNLLEAPCFGFTGVSGINSLGAAQQGVRVTIIDHKGSRLHQIEELWNETETNADFLYSAAYEELPFADNHFEMSWNFSALWFVKNIEKFLSELTRVTDKAILLIVPNTKGLGYNLQKMTTDLKKDEVGIFNPAFIKPKVFCRLMKSYNWKLVEHNFVDCPPWPDIGMKKEDFLKMIGLKFLLDTSEEDGETEAASSSICGTSIVDFYRKRDISFADRMMKYYWFERILPIFFKLFWAHHHYYLFEPQQLVNTIG